MANMNFFRLWRARDGSGSIEFALIASMLVMLLLGILDFGLGFWQQMQVANAARAGAQYAVKNGYDSTSIQTAETNATALSGLTTPAPTQFCGCPNATTGITAVTCGSVCNSGTTAGTYVTVNAQASFATIFSWTGVASPMTLASSVMV